MRKLRLMIVEDVEEELDSCRDEVADYNRDQNRDIELVECKTLDEALEKLDSSFDGAFIDLKLTPMGDEGNKVIERMRQTYLRIPIFIFTGNPGTWNESVKDIKIYRKGAIGYYGLLDKFCETYDTGLTRIMGGRGIMEKNLTEVFFENLLPQIETWVSYGKEYLEKEPERTEKALLRHALNHLLQLLEEDNEKYFPEEVYLYPPMSDKFTTGSIVKAADQWFVVLSPACDLVLKKNGTFRTDCVLCVEIEKTENIVDKVLTETGIKRMRDANKKQKRTEELLEKIFRNNYTFYYHRLPETDFFKGGFLNFRKLQTLSEDEFREQFQQPCIQISPFFVKDIVSRFSSYYGRQGQPDLDSQDFVDFYSQQQS